MAEKKPNTPQSPSTLQDNTFAPVSNGNSIANPRPAELKGGSDRILNQIEQTADYYGPMIYQNLSFFSSLELSNDENLDFIPVSQTKSNPKLFVIGLIPPSTTISGRLLDRSASVGRVTGNPDQSLDFGGKPSEASGGTLSVGGDISLSTLSPSEISNGGIVTSAGYQIKQGTGVPNRDIPFPPGMKNPNGERGAHPGLSIPQVYSAIRSAYLELNGKEGTPTELQFYTAQCLRETGGAPWNNNFGFMVNYGTTPPASGNYFLGPPEPKAKPPAPNGKYYKTFDTTTAGAKAFVAHLTKNKNVVAAAQGGDALGYMTSLAQTGYYEASVDVYYTGTKGSPPKGFFPAMLTNVSRAMAGYGVTLGDGLDLPKHPPKCCAFGEEQAKYRERVAPNGKGLKANNLNRFMAGSNYDENCKLLTQAPQVQPDTNEGWKDQGSANASASVKEESSVVGLEDLNKSELGKKFMAAQALEILATTLQLNQMKNTPPLRLMVNPITFKVSSEKIISDGGFTREGPIIEHWGEQQDKIEASGKLAAFMAVDGRPSEEGAALGGPGLTRVARNFTASYQNFLSLYLLYRNNGGLYTQGLEGNLLTRLSLVGSIYIYYDSTLYIGSFDSFNITETDSNPYSLEYDFSFTVRATFTLDSPTEDDYNVKKIFQPDPAMRSSDKQFSPQLITDSGGGLVSLPPGFTGVKS
jgi:hypothetical protein